NNSDRALKNLQVSFNVYEHGRVVDTITTVVKAIEPGETVRWQTPTTKSFSKFTVNQAIAD
ncbi:FxLYD domain-containing protein, partial [Citrobacter freundii]|uniref:FxLYD domain-containing protein n=2 Tax=Pseudomonadota TaxID=1224 RepID=UPI001BCC8FE5